MRIEEQPIAVVEWEHPIDEYSTARHDTRAFRGDERDDVDEGEGERLRG